MSSPFYVRENNLEDGSSTFDVIFTRDGESVEIACPCTQKIADEMAETLSVAYRAFAHIDSFGRGRGYDAAKLADAITGACAQALRELP